MLEKANILIEKSNVLVPLSVGEGPVFGVLGFAVVREERIWPESVVAGFKLVAHSRQRHGGFLYPEEAPQIRRQSHEVEEHMILATMRMTIPSQKRGEALKILRSLAE